MVGHVITWLVFVHVYVYICIHLHVTTIFCLVCIASFFNRAIVVGGRADWGNKGAVCPGAERGSSGLHMGMSISTYALPPRKTCAELKFDY